MLKELIIGFDCREMWLPEAEVKSWKDKSWLLNPNVTRVLSVNKTTWYSVFLHPLTTKHSLGSEVQTAMGYDRAVPIEWTTSDGFWNDLEAMDAFIVEHKEDYQRKCWTIAITIVQTPIYEEGIKEKYVRIFPIDESEPDSQWKCLGYDVEDSSFFNIGLGTSWIEEYEAERRTLWGHRLNEYYLFSNQDDAVEYAEWHFKRNSSARNLVVFGLYLIQEIP